MEPEPVRSLVAWCPDWPLVAAGIDLDTPAAVMHANRVLACTPAARECGVDRNQRRRLAQTRCPELVLIDHDAARDARRFEPVAGALDAVTPRLEIERPGLIVLPTKGPSRYFGGDAALGERCLALVATALGHRTTARIGVADGPFAAELAARWTAPDRPVRIVDLGETPQFLAPLPLTLLDNPTLVDSFLRLGLRTLGDLAGLPKRHVIARFGTPGHDAWLLAAGCDPDIPITAPAPSELRVSTELDPPVDTAEPAAFVARGMAAEMIHQLHLEGSVATSILIGAETEHGERLERIWRHSAFTAATVSERARWQLEGWLRSTHRPTAGLTRLWLTADTIAPAAGRQLGFWGEVVGGDRIIRTVARIQGLMGTGSVSVPEWRGSRHPGTQLVLVDAELVDLTVERPPRAPGDTPPWPGLIPTPSPALVHRHPAHIGVIDAHGRPVTVSARGTISAPPAHLCVDGEPLRLVSQWAGPWPVEERWWDQKSHHRSARMQIVTDDGRALLVVVEHGQWHIHATYD